MAVTSNLDGWTRKARLKEAKATAEFFQEWGVTPRIAVYAAVRQWLPYTRGVLNDLMQTYKDAEWIVKRLKKAGLKAKKWTAKNWTIDLNLAVEDGYNIHIPVNGMMGNQIFRVVLFCGGRTCGTDARAISPLRGYFADRKRYGIPREVASSADQ